MTVTEADQVRIAEESARTLTRKWGNRRDWRELFGACWEGVQKAASRGATHEHLLRHAAHMQAVTYLHWTDNGGWGPGPRKRNTRILPLATALRDRPGCEDDGVYGRLEPAVTDRPNPDRRMLSLWCETRSDRADWPLRKRVMVYLYAVEQMSLGEIGKAFGVGANCVHALIRRYVGSLRSVGGSRTGDRHRTR